MLGDVRMRNMLTIACYSLLLVSHLAAAAMPPGRLFDDALPSATRSFAGAHRRLTGKPYGPPPSRLPRFAFRGGPPDAAGAWAAPFMINFQSATGFVTSVYLGDKNSVFQQQMGRFESWECAGGMQGRYIAISHRADTYLNGTVIVTPHCEVGQVDLEKGFYYWTAAEGACPDPATVTFTAPSRRIASKSIPSATQYVCTGAEGLGVDAPAGGPGLDPGVRPGTRNARTPLPPPLDATAPFPPVFNRPSGPNDLTGVWFSDAFASGELVAPDGTVSSVGIMPDGTYLSVLVRFNSYECVKGSPGTYRASISFTQTFQDLKTVSGAGCTAGVVKLEEGGKYSWTPASDAACPEPGSDPLFVMDRVLESDLPPTPTQLACK